MDNEPRYKVKTGHEQQFIDQVLHVRSVTTNHGRAAMLVDIMVAMGNGIATGMTASTGLRSKKKRHVKKRLKNLLYQSLAGSVMDHMVEVGSVEERLYND